jgi:hypothetical protein
MTRTTPLNTFDKNTTSCPISKVVNLTTPPASPEVGFVYFDTTLDQFGVYNGTSWDYMSGSGLGITWVQSVTEKDTIVPEKIATIASGDVYRYIKTYGTIYRLVPSPYTYSGDSFYSAFDGTTLTGLIISRA